MSLSKTPPAKRLKQSSMGDYLQKSSEAARAGTMAGDASRSAHEGLKSLEELKLDDNHKQQCKDTIIDLEDDSQDEGEVSIQVNSPAVTVSADDWPDTPGPVQDFPNVARDRHHRISASSDDSETANERDIKDGATNIASSSTSGHRCNSGEESEGFQRGNPSVDEEEQSQDTVSELRERSKTTGSPGTSRPTPHNKMDALTAVKDPKRFYSTGDKASSGYTVFKCTPLQAEATRRSAGSDTGNEAMDGSSTGRSSTRDDTSKQYPENTDRGRKAKSPPRKTGLTSFPVDLDQTPGQVPPDMTRFPQDATWRTGPMASSPDHTVLVKGPFEANMLTPCEAEPAELADRWDNHHVKMPYSHHSKYTDSDGREVPRWDIIQKSLLGTIDSFDDLREAILSYNGGYVWNLNELENVIEEMSSAARHDFFNTLLPDIIRLALNLPTICTRPPPLLVQGHSHSVTMSQRQVASLLANAFLCTFPRRNSSKPGSQYSTYPTINFHTLFNRGERPQRRQCKKEKISCILNYFRRVTREMPVGNLTFTRLRFRCRVGWEESMANFKGAFVTSEGLIEDQGHGMLMVDFANRRVGGGVLREGCVQEEILFVIYPELIVSRLFTEALGDDEALLMTGAERFNEYTGYSDDFRWRGNVIDVRDRDNWGRRYTQMVAIDAVAYRGTKQQHQQFGAENVMRDLVKSFCGFQTPGFPRSAVATGNWGCGAFGGDARLKFLLQWMAASRAGRPLVYFTFGDHELMCQLRAMQELVARQDITIGDMFLLLKRYDRLYVANEVTKCPSLYDFIYTTFEDKRDRSGSDTDSN